MRAIVALGMSGDEVTAMIKRRMVMWLMSGSAAVAAILALPGCSTQHPARTVAVSNPAHADVMQRSLGGDSPNAPAVNLFGEFDGMQRGRFASAGGIGDANFQQHTFPDEGADSCVAVDPTGKWLCFASTRHSRNASLYLQRVDGLSVTQLTDDGADAAFPAFSPDGKRIAFCSTRSGTWNLYVMDVDGRNCVQVTSGQSQDLHPSFSPDGRKLVYCSMSPRSSQWELWTINLLTHERKTIGTGLFPTWSPAKSADGTDRIAFQRARERGSRWFSLWTLDLINGEASRMTEVAVSSNAAIITPAWSTNNRLFMVSDRNGADSIWSTHVNMPGETMASNVPGPTEPVKKSPETVLTNEALGSAR
jgi:TolB protein